MVAVGAYRSFHKLGHRERQLVGGAVPDEGYGVSDRDQGVRGLAEEDLMVGELVEERLPVGYVAVQQEGGPALPVKPVHPLLEVRPLSQGELLERHPSLTPRSSDDPN